MNLPSVKIYVTPMRNITYSDAGNTIRKCCPFQQDTDEGESIKCGNWCPLFRFYGTQIKLNCTTQDVWFNVSDTVEDK